VAPTAQTLMLLTVYPMLTVQANEKLDSRQEAIVRRAVYENEPLINSSPAFLFQGELGIPEPLAELAKNHRREVIELLLKIMDGGSPKDSALAAGYAVSLLSGPRVGVVCVERFDKATYDEVDKDWETTPRQHWIDRVRAGLKEESRGAKAER
jgi:hypothetical protein